MSTACMTNKLRGVNSCMCSRQKKQPCLNLVSCDWIANKGCRKNRQPGPHAGLRLDSPVHRRAVHNIAVRLDRDPSPSEESDGASPLHRGTPQAKVGIRKEAFDEPALRRPSRRRAPSLLWGKWRAPLVEPPLPRDALPIGLEENPLHDAARSEVRDISEAAAKDPAPGDPSRSNAASLLQGKKQAPPLEPPSPRGTSPASAPSLRPDEKRPLPLHNAAQAAVGSVSEETAKDPVTGRPSHEHVHIPHKGQKRVPSIEPSSPLDASPDSASSDSASSISPKEKRTQREGRKYATASRLGEALHRHCIKAEPLAPDVQHCLAEMIKTDYANPTWKNRFARRLQSFTRGKSDMCSYDICDLERLEGQKAVLDLGKDQKHRLIVPRLERCSDAKLANLHSVDQCHKGLGLAVTEFAVMAALGLGGLSKRVTSSTVGLANLVFPFTALPESISMASGMSGAILELVKKNVFGKALSLFGMTIVPALTSLFMIMPSWSMPDCKQGHYATEGWLMFFCSSLTGFLFYWVASMTMATETFLTTLKNTTSSGVVDELRKWGLVPVAMVDKVAHTFAASTDAAGRTYALFKSLADYVFRELPPVIVDFMGGFTEVFSVCVAYKWIPDWALNAWNMGLTDFAGRITIEAWTHLFQEMQDASDHARFILHGTNGEKATGVVHWAQSMIGSVQNFLVPTTPSIHKENLASWAISGLAIQNISMYMLRFKDWATCFMVRHLMLYLKRNELRHMKKRLNGK